MALRRVVLADDMPELLASVTELLRRDFEIVGSAQNGEEVIEATAALDPDLLVIAISMPVLNGDPSRLTIASGRLQARIVFLTVHEDEDYVDAPFQ